MMFKAIPRNQYIGGKMLYNSFDAIELFVFIMIFACQDAIKDIYEFVLFKDYGNTHRFKRTYRKRPFLKRFFILTIFDEELTKPCRHEKLLRKICFADIIHLSLGLVVIVMGAYTFITDNDNYKWAFFAYYLVLGVFYVWYLAHSIRWEEWIKGNWRKGQREFQIRLPDEKNKK